MVNAVLEFVHGETLLLLSRSKMYASSSCIKPPNHGMFALPIVIFLVNSGCILFFEGNKPDCCSVSPNSSSCLEDRVYRPILVHQWIWRVPRVLSSVLFGKQGAVRPEQAVTLVKCRTEQEAVYGQTDCVNVTWEFTSVIAVYMQQHTLDKNPPGKETFTYWCV